GNGLTILSSMLVQQEVKAGTLAIVPVNGVRVEREIRLIYHRNKYLSKQLLALMEISQQALRHETEGSR
ncbi:MAG: LysR substrate-binding domain-containing protein, partial [Clostridia bacterium]